MIVYSLVSTLTTHNSETAAAAAVDISTTMPHAVCALARTRQYHSTTTISTISIPTRRKRITLHSHVNRIFSSIESPAIDRGFLEYTNKYKDTTFSKK